MIISAEYDTITGGPTEIVDKDHYWSMDTAGILTFTNGQNVSLEQYHPKLFNCKDYTSARIGSSGITCVGYGIKEDFTGEDVTSQINSGTVNVTNYDYLVLIRSTSATTQPITFS